MKRILTYSLIFVALLAIISTVEMQFRISDRNLSQLDFHTGISNCGYQISQAELPFSSPCDNQIKNPQNTSIRIVKTVSFQNTHRLFFTSHKVQHQIYFSHFSFLENTAQKHLNGYYLFYLRKLVI